MQQPSLMVEGLRVEYDERETARSSSVTRLVVYGTIQEAPVHVPPNEASNNKRDKLSSV